MNISKNLTNKYVSKCKRPLFNLFESYSFILSEIIKNSKPFNYSSERLTTNKL